MGWAGLGWLTELAGWAGLIPLSLFTELGTTERSAFGHPVPLLGIIETSQIVVFLFF